MYLIYRYVYRPLRSRVSCLLTTYAGLPPDHWCQRSVITQLYHHVPVMLNCWTAISHIECLESWHYYAIYIGLYAFAVTDSAKSKTYYHECNIVLPNVGQQNIFTDRKGNVWEIRKTWSQHQRIIHKAVQIEGFDTIIYDMGYCVCVYKIFLVDKILKSMHPSFMYRKELWMETVLFQS